MSLRSRIALLVGVTVLLASAIGGIGTLLSSRTVGRDRVDLALSSDASRIQTEIERGSPELQFLFEVRRRTCTDVERGDGQSGDDQALDDGRGGQRGSFDRGRGPRQLPEFSSSMQWVLPNGTVLAACKSLPTTAVEKDIAAAGAGASYRTVVIEGERFRLLTNGYENIGAIQFARSLEITQDTLRGLLVRSIAFGLIGAAIAAALGWAFASRATDPLQRLSAAAERVATTQDLGERIDVAGDREVAALATSFNTMLSSLDTSREQQQRLVQDASHELRTPLTSMRTNVELLQRHAHIDADTREQILDDIGAELRELTALTAELVDSATEIPTVIELSAEVDLVDIVTDCVERSRRRHHQTFHLSVHDDASGTVVGDAALLGRCVTNLINNAAKFSDAETTIEVEVTATAVHVRDQGPGIDTADLPRIFDRFYRATEARSAPGSGLGLAIVKQIIEAHGGTVAAANRSGGGAEVSFHLPAAPDV